jgi:hypothetical protein
MSLARTDFADDQQAFVAARIALFGEIGRQKVSLGQRGVGTGEIRVVVGQFTVLVAPRNSAAVITPWARTRNWQSQRVTRRSFTLPGLETVFHPEPSHNGQISTGALITAMPHSRMTTPRTYSGALASLRGTAQGAVPTWVLSLLNLH